MAAHQCGAEPKSKGMLLQARGPLFWLDRVAETPAGENRRALLAIAASGLESQMTVEARFDRFD